MVRSVVLISALLAGAAGPAVARTEPAAGPAPAAQSAVDPARARYPGACDPAVPTASEAFICMAVGTSYDARLRRNEGVTMPYQDSVRFFGQAGDCVRLTATAGPGEGPDYQYVWNNLAAWNAESGGTPSHRAGRPTGSLATGYTGWREWRLPETGWHRAKLWSNQSRLALQLTPCG
jgi:hypothetical protein